MADEAKLFDNGADGDRQTGGTPTGGTPRFRMPRRDQAVFTIASLDETLPDDDQARAVWAFVGGLDLSPWRAGVKAVEGGPGQAPADPRVLLALWLFATLRGVGEARELDRLCRRHLSYQWLCGGVSTNHHTLADFRTARPEALHRLLVEGVAALLAEGLVTLDRVAQDGVKVRAAAGAASFRRKPALEQCLADAEAQLAALAAEAAADPAAGSKRRRAARQRAARERQQRVHAALAQLPAVAALKDKGKEDQARVSTTDPEARVMKMGDGGFRPAVNVQFVTDTASQVVVGVAVSNAGGDQGQLEPLAEALARDYDKRPTGWLADGGYVKLEALARQEELGTAMYVPPPQPRVPPGEAPRDRYAPRPGDSAELAAWRQRMGTPEAQAIYRERAATAECVNAQARNHGLRQLNVQGLSKALATALWHALAHNFRRTLALHAAAAANLPTTLVFGRPPAAA